MQKHSSTGVIFLLFALLRLDVVFGAPEAGGKDRFEFG
jgi:hypothetical protein